jgi:hypothetical protein
MGSTQQVNFKPALPFRYIGQRTEGVLKKKKRKEKKREVLKTPPIHWKLHPHMFFLRSGSKPQNLS